MDSKISMVPCVNASQMSEEVIDWCGDNDISVHCATELYCIDDDGNPLAEWLKSLGYEFKEGSDWVGVFGN